METVATVRFMGTEESEKILQKIIHEQILQVNDQWTGYQSPGMTIDLGPVTLPNVKFIKNVHWKNLNDLATEIEYVAYV